MQSVIGLLVCAWWRSRLPGTAACAGRRRHVVVERNRRGPVGRHHSRRQRHGEERRDRHGIHRHHQRSGKLHGPRGRSRRLHA